MTKSANKKKTKKTTSKSGKAEVSKKQEGGMDRPTLIGITHLLADAGSDVKARTKDTDDQLQKKVNDALQRLPSHEVIKQLEAIDPDKLVNQLKRDCLGIFVDLSDVSCILCPDVKTCCSKFIDNLRGGFTRVAGATTDKSADKSETFKAGITPVTRYEDTRLVFVRDVKNPNPKEDDLHDTIQRILNKQPETLGELRVIVEKDFTIEGDGDFMKFVTALRDPKEGVIKLDVDLTSKDKAALREAGYDV